MYRYIKKNRCLLSNINNNNSKCNNVISYAYSSNKLMYVHTLAQENVFSSQF